MTNALDKLIEEITTQVTQQVQEQMNKSVSTAVRQRLDFLSNENLEKMIDNDYIENELKTRIDDLVTKYTPDLTLVDKHIQSLTAQWADRVDRDISSKVGVIIDERISEVDVNSLILKRIAENLDPDNRTYPFIDKSINASALNTDELRITGDHIVGGVIKNFGSTGIDDQATDCKVTILDHGTVFENTLYAPKIEVKGGAMIDGDLEIQGRIVDTPAYQQLIADAAQATQSVLTNDTMVQSQNLIFERIREEGIDLNKVTFQGKVLIVDDKLVGVTHSQLRSVGTLQDLQTNGDTFLSESMFVANKRVGINTMDPKNALSVWDEEIEVSVGKNQKGVGRIAVERNNDLVLGSNDNDNITLKPDGTTVIPKLQINNMVFTTGSVPSYDAPKGTIVFNENPTLGGPLGWVSLGDSRWANFGIID